MARPDAARAFDCETVEQITVKECRALAAPPCPRKISLRVDTGPRGF